MELLIALIIILALALPIYLEIRLRRRIKEVYERYNGGETFVVIDLETTGLNARKDEITEVGAIKFRNDEVLEEFSTLVNPRKPIPYVVRQKTGITTEMVKKAPRFEWIRDDLRTFLNDYPILGYNLSFDLAFLRRQGLKLSNSTYDILEIAKRRLPKRTRYGRRRSYRLQSIARNLGVSSGDAHRALDDARATTEVFKKLNQAS